MDRAVTSVAIIIPVLNRPNKVQSVMENVELATPQPHRLLFVANEGDDAEIAALCDAGADHLIVSQQRISWACKINDGYRATTEEWIFTGADDLLFHQNWFGRALRWDKFALVIGTNDICNHRVMTGQHSTHTLFRRDYVDKFGTIDGVGVMHEGYRHDYTDDEAIATAKARGVYAHAFDSIVEHLHPMNGKSPDDETYRGGRQHSREGKRLFMTRQHLWRDEKKAQSMMIPAPERAVVVTATFGGHDPHLRVPVQQDIPAEYICFTDDPALQVPAPWKIQVVSPRYDAPRMAAKVPKMVPWELIDCPDVVWMDASHEITDPAFVREALASRHDGIAAFKHPRRGCVYQELDALRGPEGQNRYTERPLDEMFTSYRDEGIPTNLGLYACGVVAWDAREEKTRRLGELWLEETARWSYHDQVELPVVCHRLGITPGIFPVNQIDPRLSRGHAYLANRWVRIHPHAMKQPLATVLIPFASEDPARVAAYNYVRAKYEEQGWQVVTGSCEPPWSKGLALAQAYREARHDILIIADSDCLIDMEVLRQAVVSIQNGAHWVVPHRHTWRSDRNSTRRMIMGQKPRPMGPMQQTVIGGGIVVLSREAWDKVGGVDPRFTEWGGEDISFGWALETFFGLPVRGAGKLLHLWHPPHLPRKGNAEAEALAGRYLQAKGHLEEMSLLIEEAKQLT